MKNVFYSHSILIFLGRPLTLFLLLFPLSCLAWCTWIFAEQHDTTFLPVMIGLAFMEILSIYVCKVFWPLCWGKLIVTNDKITWKCLFYKTQIINIDKIQDVIVSSFSDGNYVKLDLYNSGFKYVIITEQTIPNIRVDKIKCKNGTIKFLYSYKLQSVLRCKLPRNFRRRL